MTWVRFDDTFAQHPKVIGLSDAAFRLHVAAICYCSQHETDGVIVTAAARALVGSRAVKLSIMLVGAGLWDVIDADVYRVHDYLEYNPSREQNETKRIAKRMAGAIGAASRWHDRGNAPEPEPVPVPQEKEAASGSEPPDDAHLRCYRAWQNQSPSGLNKYVLDGIDGLLEDGLAPELFEDACRRAGEAGGNKGWRYVSSIVQRLKSGVPEKARINGTDGTSFVSGLDIVPNTGLRLVSEDEL